MYRCVMATTWNAVCWEPTNGKCHNVASSQWCISVHLSASWKQGWERSSGESLLRLSGASQPLVWWTVDYVWTASGIYPGISRSFKKSDPGRQNRSMSTYVTWGNELVNSVSRTIIHHQLGMGDQDIDSYSCGRKQRRETCSFETWYFFDLNHRCVQI